MILPASDSLTIRQDGTSVLLLHNGTLVASLPWQAALEVGKALLLACKQAEAYANIDQLIHDQALIQRLGLPVGLTNDPKIQTEALKEAQWGNMRRYVPSTSIASGEAVGTPIIKKGE